MTYTIPRPAHGPDGRPERRPERRHEHRPEQRVAKDRPEHREPDETTEVARRAAHLSAELAGLFDRLAEAAPHDPRIRQARYRLQDASYLCRRAGEELDGVASGGRPRRGQRA